VIRSRQPHLTLTLPLHNFNKSGINEEGHDIVRTAVQTRRNAAETCASLSLFSVK